jgi:uncharacterized protein (TIGR03118 family)
MSMSTRLRMFLAAAFLVLPLCSSASAQYVRTDLVTDSGAGGTVADGNLVNAWGLTALPGSPFWVSDNATGKSTLYTGAGQKIPLVVTVPGLLGTQGTPTGIVGNPVPTDFIITENGKSAHAIFIFATLDGTISGWNPNVGGLSATIAKDRSDAGAVYTGLAIGSNQGHNFLFAADGGANRRIDVFDATFHLADLGPDAFADPKIPRNFTPYGMQTIANKDGSETVWVTYTALNKAQGGFIDAFTTAGVLIHHFAVQGPLHSPWGIAQAPADFGPLSNALLVSNNISRGRINAFDPNTGQFLGPLRDESNNPIEIDGIWAIQFGQDGGPNGRHNELFFTAGPSTYLSGTFGVITVGP